MTKYLFRNDVDSLSITRVMSCSWLLVLCAYVHVLSAMQVEPVGTRIPTYAGPFRTVMERFERCDQNGGITENSLEKEKLVVNVTRLTRVAPGGGGGGTWELQRLWGNLTLLTDLDDSLAAFIRIDQWSNNNWKSNAFRMNFASLCFSLMDLGLLPRNYSCSLRKGVYPFRDISTDWAVPAFPEFPYGKWRADVVFSVHGLTMGCVRGVFQTHPLWT